MTACDPKATLAPSASTVRFLSRQLLDPNRIGANHASDLIRQLPIYTVFITLIDVQGTHKKQLGKAMSLKNALVLSMFVLIWSPSFASEVRIDIRKIAGASMSEVAAEIGDPIFCRDGKYGETCGYAKAETEIVFIKGKADWITIEGIDDVPFAENALRVVGLSPMRPNFRSDYAMKWEPYMPYLSVSLFKGGDKSDYFYIKVATK